MVDMFLLDMQTFEKDTFVTITKVNQNVGAVEYV